MIKILKVLLIFVVLSTIGCASTGIKTQDKKIIEMTFVDSSNGLPFSGQWRHGIAFFDINGDGHIDILAPPPRQASNGYKEPLVWYGNGGKEWKESRLNIPSDIEYDYGSISVSDFDGDGIPDIALAMHGIGLKILKGIGSGRFRDYSKGLPDDKEFRSRALVSADFNNDGIADIAAVSEARFKREDPQPGGVRTCYSSDDIWRCNAIGNEEDVLGLYADQLFAGDVNGDGNKDIAVASLVYVRDLIIWLGDGKGGFKPFNKGLTEKMTYLSVALEDINMDGRDDLAASIAGIGRGTFRGLKVFLSDNDSFKEMSEGLPAEEVFTSVRICDLNNDNNAELVASTGVGGIKVFSKKGNGWQEVKVSGLSEKGYYRIYKVYCPDINKDGYKDIAINYAYGKDDSGGIRVFLNVANKD